MSSIFQRLISYSPREGRMAYEDFVTELMCGVIEDTPMLKGKFIRWMLNRLGASETSKSECIDGWYIQTQYRIDSKNRPDIAILDENDNVKLLIEHKIDSEPYEDQPRRYAQWLRDTTAIGLVLLTKYHALDSEEENKIRERIPFSTAWWSELSDYLIRTSHESGCFREKYLLHEFVRFLQEEGMAVPDRFEANDISAMQKFPNVIAIMDKILNSVINSSEFKNLKIEIAREATRSTQMRTHGRYVLFGSLGGKSESLTVFVGFLFDEGHIGFIRKETGSSEDCSSPIAFVSVEVEPGMQDGGDLIVKLRKFAREEHEHRWHFLEKGTREYWTRLIAFLPIEKLATTEGAGKPNHVQELSDLFKERMRELGRLKEFLALTK